MPKPISEGTEEIDGEKVHWYYYYNKRTKRGYIKARYDGQNLIEDDHGFGVDHARSLLRLDVIARKKNKEDNKG
jgi:hypothetical protein